MLLQPIKAVTCPKNFVLIPPFPAMCKGMLPDTEYDSAYSVLDSQKWMGGGRSMGRAIVYYSTDTKQIRAIVLVLLNIYNSFIN